MNKRILKKTVLRHAREMFNYYAEKKEHGNAQEKIKFENYSLKEDLASTETAIRNLGRKDLEYVDKKYAEWKKASSKEVRGYGKEDCYVQFLHRAWALGN